MNLFRKIRQMRCKHYFVFSPEDSPTNSENVIQVTAFKCHKCGEIVRYNNLFLGKAEDNTYLEYAKLRHKYLEVLREVNPSKYIEESRKLYDRH